MWRDFFKPKNENWRWAFCFALSIYLFLFVLLVEPFKNDKITYVWTSKGDYVGHCISNLVFVTLITMLSVLVVPKYFPKYFSPDRFTFQRFCGFTLSSALFIEVYYFFIDYYYFHFEISLFWFITFMVRVTLSSFLFAGVPFFLGFLQIFNYFNNIEKNNTEKVKITPLQNAETPIYEKNMPSNDATRTPQYNSDLAPQMLCFSDNSNRKNLEIPLDRFYYITSAQNYIEVFYRDKNAVDSRHVLRNSLKSIEEKMIESEDNSPLIRCHKAFIVNREKVVELRGPAKAAHFILEDIEAPIPVSRQKYAELEQQFSTLDDDYSSN